ncbi:MAG: DEAD/DEAH box helicase [Polyangiaceae bacterium]
MRTAKRASSAPGKASTTARTRRLNASKGKSPKTKASAKPTTRKAKARITRKAKAAPVRKAKATIARKAKAARVRKAKATITRKAKAAPVRKAKATIARKAKAARVRKAKATIARKAKAAPVRKAKATIARKAKAAPVRKAKATIARKAKAAPIRSPAAERVTKPVQAPSPAPRTVAASSPVAPATAPSPAREAAPVLRVAEATSPAPAQTSAVRVGRLPPRGEAQRAAPPELARPSSAHATRGGDELTVAPTLPRAPFEHSVWQRVDALAKELDTVELVSEQRQAIRAVLEGRDGLVCMPAGFSRSLCFVIPAQLFTQPVLVVGPRPALLRELHDKLVQRRVKAVRLDASLTDGHAKQALERIAEGGPLIVLASPDMLGTDALPRALARSGIALAVVDDAHTVTGVADELSPAGLGLGRALARLGRPPVLALTSHASSAVRHELSEVLDLRSPLVSELPLVRKNLVLDVLGVRGEARQRALVQLVLQLRRPGIVFAPTARDVDAIYGALLALRLPVHRYHPHLPPGDRVGEQLNFLLPGRRSIMVATSAFGSATGVVGVGEASTLDRAPQDFGLTLEKRDLRFVVHWALPPSPEQYLREISLAGRDGEEATAVLFHDGSDRARHEATFAQSRIPSRHLTHFAKALESAAIDGHPRTLESLALSSGLSRKLTEVLAAVLADAGLVSVSQGWLRASVPAHTLLAGAQRLAATLDRLRAQDNRRLSGMSSIVDGSGCIVQRFARYFEQARGEPCGRCGSCKGSVLPTFDVAPSVESSPARRPPVETFSLGRPDSYGIGVAAPARAARPLTVKLADFQRGR